MERRDWSLEALKKLQYIDTLDDNERASGLLRWAEKYLREDGKIDFDLEIDNYKKLSELFYKNIHFLKNFNNDVKRQLSQMRKMKTFLHNS